MTDCYNLLVNGHKLAYKFIFENFEQLQLKNKAQAYLSGPI